MPGLLSGRALAQSKPTLDNPWETRNGVAGAEKVRTESKRLSLNMLAMQPGMTTTITDPKLKETRPEFNKSSLDLTFGEYCNDARGGVKNAKMNQADMKRALQFGKVHGTDACLVVNAYGMGVLQRETETAMEDIGMHSFRSLIGIDKDAVFPPRPAEGQLNREDKKYEKLESVKQVKEYLAPYQKEFEMQKNRDQDAVCPEQELLRDSYDEWLNHSGLGFGRYAEAYLPNFKTIFTDSGNILASSWKAMGANKNANVAVTNPWDRFEQFGNAVSILMSSDDTDELDLQVLQHQLVSMGEELEDEEWDEFVRLTGQKPKHTKKGQVEKFDPKSLIKAYHNAKKNLCGEKKWTVKIGTDTIFKGQLGISYAIKDDRLLVKHIKEAQEEPKNVSTWVNPSVVGTYNERHAEIEQIKEGDLIVGINGLSDILEMENLMKAPSYPIVFDVYREVVKSWEEEEKRLDAILDKRKQEFEEEHAETDPILIKEKKKEAEKKKKEADKKKEKEEKEKKDADKKKEEPDKKKEDKEKEKEEKKKKKDDEKKKKEEEKEKAKAKK